MSLRDYSHIQRIAFVSLTGTLYRATGSITSATSGAGVTGTGTSFIGQVPTGSRIYDATFRLIGIVSTVTNDTSLTLTGNASLTYTGGFIVATSEPTTYAFEVRDLSIGLDERRDDYELVDGTLLQSHVNYRTVFAFSTPYLRRATTGTYDFTDVLTDFDDTAKRVYIIITDIASHPVEVVKRTDQITTAVRRQIIAFGFDFACVAKQTTPTVPTWYRITKGKPGYL